MSVFGRPGGLGQITDYQRARPVNPGNSPVDNNGDYRPLANLEIALHDPQNETPAALAGATGADQIEQVFKSQTYCSRADTATALCYAIAECDPEDACVIIGAALDGLRQHLLFGVNPHFREAVESFRAERRRIECNVPSPPLSGGIMAGTAAWISGASRAERKSSLVAIFQSLSADDRTAFVRRLDPEGNFSRRAAP